MAETPHEVGRCSVFLSTIRNSLFHSYFKLCVFVCGLFVQVVIFDSYFLANTKVLDS